jgi:chromosome segregation ATPase
MEALEMAEDKEKEPVQKDWQAEIKKREAENFKAREKARKLEEELESLRPLANKAKELEAAQLTEQEKAQKQLDDLNAQIAETQSQLETAQKTAVYQGYVNEFDVDVEKYGAVLEAAMDNLPLDNKEEMAARLEPFKRDRKAPTPTTPVVNPESKQVPANPSDLKNLSVKDRLSAYEQMIKSGG